MSKTNGDEGPPSLEDIESLREIIFSRKKEARESANGLEIAAGSCSAGVDKCRMDLIVVQSDFGFLDAFSDDLLMPSRLDAAHDFMISSLAVRYAARYTRQSGSAFEVFQCR